MSTLQHVELPEKVAAQLRARQNPQIYPEAPSLFGPERVVLPPFFKRHWKAIDEFAVKEESDIWLCSFIKAGTTWTKELAWLLLHGLDYEAAKVNSYVRIPYLEFDATWPVAEVSSKLRDDDETKPQTSMEVAAQLESPRLIQTHLQWSLLPAEIRSGAKRPKIIYVARNPKDICVSFYHHRVLIEGYKGTIDEFVDEFVSDLSFYGPFWSHVRKFWEIRHEPNVLFLTYEEMKEDLAAVVARVAKFLGKTLNGEQKERLLRHLSFESMRANPWVNLDEITELLTRIHGQERKTHFFRKGKVGSWKEELSRDSIRKLNEWMDRNKIPGLWD